MICLRSIHLLPCPAETSVEPSAASREPVVLHQESRPETDRRVSKHRQEAENQPNYSVHTSPYLWRQTMFLRVLWFAMDGVWPASSGASDRRRVKRVWPAGRRRPSTTTPRPPRGRGRGRGRGRERGATVLETEQRAVHIKKKKKKIKDKK